MASIKKIKKGLLRYGRMPQNYFKAKVIKNSVDIRYSKGTNAIIYIGLVQGRSSKYRVQASFFNVIFSQERSNVFNTACKIGSDIYYHAKPNFVDNPIKLKSSDPDFRFRFEKPLFDNKALIGNWTRYDAKKEDKKNGASAREIKNTDYYKVTHPQGGSYIRKTPQPNKPMLPKFPDGGRPFLNPHGYTGYSYPVNTFLKYLVDSNLVNLK